MFPAFPNPPAMRFPQLRADPSRTNYNDVWRNYQHTAWLDGILEYAQFIMQDPRLRGPDLTLKAIWKARHANWITSV